MTIHVTTMIVMPVRIIIRSSGHNDRSRNNNGSHRGHGNSHRSHIDRRRCHRHNRATNRSTRSTPANNNTRKRQADSDMEVNARLGNTEGSENDR